MPWPFTNSVGMWSEGIVGDASAPKLSVEGCRSREPLQSLDIGKDALFLHPDLSQMSMALPRAVAQHGPSMSSRRLLFFPGRCEFVAWRCCIVIEYYMTIFSSIDWVALPDRARVDRGA